MALSDTAKLVASLTLEDKFTKPLAGADKALSGFERHAGSMSKVGDQVSRGLGNLGRNVALIGAAAAGFLAIQVKAGVESLIVLESAQAQTEAVLKSTGNVAGQTADSIRALAEEYEGLNATIDDKVIQSAENLLLTFTKINEKAFEPALAAALDLNQALGGGEEGLQGVIIQVGKALNDPIRGLTALRRVGVSFTKEQEDRIKGLVKANDLFGAQQVILQELNREFGGSFAAAGDTTAGKFAKVTDAIEDAQMALAVGFLPLLTKVADKLSTVLADPATIARIEDFGMTLADGVESLITLGTSLPWESIGNAFEIAGTGAKAVLDTFLKMPPWVQTAVLTGWGLNKLTGGALGGIVNALASGLIKGVLGMNAGVVNINAATVNGGLPGTGGTGGGGLSSGAINVIGTAGAAAAVGGGILAINDIAAGTEEGTRAGWVAISGGFPSLIARAITEVIGDPLGDLVDELTKPEPTALSTTAGPTFRQLEQQGEKLRNIDERIRAETAQIQRQHVTTTSLLGRTSRATEGIERKNFSPTINVRTQSNLYIAGRTVQAIITQQQLKVGTGPQEF